ncbi:MAG: class-II fumarase/aspartase family protein [Hyphomicrobiaceae bacterium]
MSPFDRIQGAGDGVPELSPIAEDRTISPVQSYRHGATAVSLQPSSLRFADPGIRALYDVRSRWQSWLDVEAALAQAQAELGIIPTEAAEIIVANAELDRLDDAAIRGGLVRTGHALVPVVWELARVCGEEAGGYVHWGATTQNVLEAGDNLLLRQAHQIFCAQLADLLEALADLAERGAEMAMPGRTHGQHAVPVTFGYKVAVWIDELVRHVERLRGLEDRVFVAMMGGGAGSYASLGEQGPNVQAGMAARLGLASAMVPSRTHGDREAEYVCTLGLMAATQGKIANEIYTLMKQEFGEAREPVPAGTVGSSTMPQKRNPILCQDEIADAARLRALVPLALEAMVTEHEANRTTSVIMRETLTQACVLTGDMLSRLIVITRGLDLDPERMRANLDLTDGLILSESIMMDLGRSLGRQTAHDLVYDAVETVLAGEATFSEALASDSRVRDSFGDDAARRLADPAAYTGLCAAMAKAQSVVARSVAGELRGGLDRSRGKAS